MKNTFVKVLSFVMALMMVVGTFGTLAVFAAECTHENAVGTPVPATCDKFGYTKYHCPDCGKNYIDDVVPAKTSHNYVEQGKTPADCEHAAQTAGLVCADCGEKHPEKGPKPDETVNGGNPLGHVAGQKWYEAKKTCTDNAYTYQLCLRCGAEQNKTVKPNTAGHEYIYNVVTPATKCESGKVAVTCADCDFAEVIVQAEDHKWTAMLPINETDDAEAKKRGLVAGDTCEYTFKSGEYCVDCYTTRNEVRLGDDAKHSNDPLYQDVKDEDDKYFGATLITSDTPTQSAINAQISAMINPATGKNFKVGDVTYVEHTCTENGWYLSYCEDCDKYVIKVDEAPEGGHVAGEFGQWSTTAAGVSKKFAANTKAEDIQKSEYHKYTFTQVQKCTVCKETLKTNTANKVGHDYTNVEEDDTYTVVVPVTCTLNGYTVHTCKLCGDTETVDIVVCKGEHNFEGAKYNKVENYNCATNNKTVAYCQNPECDTNREDDKKTPEADYSEIKNAAHDYQLDEIAGTCQEASKYQEKCVNCGDTKVYNGDKTPANAAKNPENHVCKDGKAGTYITITSEVKKQKYCTDEEITTYICKCGERVGVVTKAAGEHEIKENVSYNGTGVAGVTCDASDCKTSGHIHLNYVKKDPTCAEGGQTAGKLCVKCGYSEKAPTQLDKNKNNHVGTQNTYDKVAATCQTGGYTPKYCTTCTAYYIVDDKDAEGNVIGPVPANHKLSEVIEGYAPSCVNPGKKDHYKCIYCDKLFVDGEEVTSDKLVIEPTAKAHTWSTRTSTTTLDQYKSPRYETCSADGFLEYRFCVTCQTADGSKDYSGWTPAKVKVVQIQNADKTVVVDDPATKDVNEAYEAIRVAAHGANYTKDWSYLVRKNGENVIGATCTAGAWIYLPERPACMYCELYADRNVTDKWVGTANSVKNGYWQNALDHKKADGSSALVPVEYINLVEVDGEYVVENCQKPTYVYSKCDLCKVTSLTSYNDAISKNGEHRYELNDDKTFKTIKTHDPECDAEGYKYVECLDCEYENKLETIPALGHYVLNGSVKTPISFECEKFADFKGMTCSDCKLVVGQDTLAHNKVTDSQEGNCVTDKYTVVYCLDCNESFADENEYVKAPGHDKDVAANDKFIVSDNSVATTYRCKVCGEDYVVAKAVVETLKVSGALSAKKVASGSEISYTIKLSGKAYEFSALKLVVDYNEDLFDVDLDVDTTLAGAEAFASAENGKLGITIVVGYDIATGDAKKVTTAVEGTEIVTVKFTAKKYAANTANFKVTELNGSAISCDPAEATVVGVGDVDGKDNITPVDAAAITALYGSTDTTYDFNNDGIVDIDDLAMLAKFVASKMTAKDYLIFRGDYAEVAATIDALFENGEMLDVNDDTVVNVNDRLVLATAVENFLVTTNYNAIDFDSVAEFVAREMNALVTG